jgi:hypothetical protein
MAEYAKDTKVPVQQSLNEIDRILTRYGAQQFGWGKDMARGRAFIGFSCKGITYKMEFELPLQGSKEFAYYKRGSYEYKRSDSEILARWEQAHRQRWRAVALYIKAKLEAVESGISGIEQEFMSHILLPDGRTLKDFIIPQLESGIALGKMPLGLPFFEGVK